MKKKLFATLVSVSLLSTMVLSGCGQNSTDEKVTSGVIRIAYNNIENYPHYKGLERAAQEIEDRSDGRFTVKILFERNTWRSESGLGAYAEQCSADVCCQCDNGRELQS